MGFTRSTLLEEHMEEVHDNEISMANLESFATVKKHQCPMCTRSFHFQNVLIKHIAQHEEANVSAPKEYKEDMDGATADESNASSSGTTHECKICGKVRNSFEIIQC
jgi:DNA-directed RNA polymerase subunit M/transcription elongation factor TFIIS